MPYLKLWTTNGKKDSGGFTLIEILVAVAIIAVLALSAFITYGNLTKRSRDTKRLGDLEQLRQALEMYRSFYGFYPPSAGGGWVNASGLSSSLVPTYIAAIPPDPKNTGIYVYYYKALTPISGNYYAYCLSASIEGTPPASTCTSNSQNYGLGNP